MPYVWVGFRVDPPIRETIGKTPDDIELTKENDVVTEMRVLIGEERTEKIKSSESFQRIVAESEDRWAAKNPGKTRDTTEKSRNFINLLEQEIRSYATQKANNFINQLNIRLDSATYNIELKELAILTLQRHVTNRVGGYVKSGYITDIYEIDDEDNVSNRIINDYANGLKALKNDDPVSAYLYFYLAFPENHKITSDPALNLDLKILRDGASHNVLNSRALQDRAKDLLGNDFVKPDKADATKTYACIDKTNPKHINLFKTHIPIVKKSAKDYIDSII